MHHGAMPVHCWVQGHVAECEPIYSTQFSCEEVPAEWLAAWEAAAEPALHLPKHNPFIPTDFDLLHVRLPSCANASPWHPIPMCGKKALTPDTWWQPCQRIDQLCRC